jgi:3-oxocholest-4-en-26-oate---CoA ligase
LRNGTEYLEGMLAAFKLRAVPINVNHRYTAAELAPLYDDAGLTALVHHRGMSPEIDQALASLDTPLTVRLWVDDDTDVDAPAGADGYEQVLAAADAARPDGSTRTSDDLYIVYTGGTTGNPKGVMWRHEDIFFAAMGGGDVTRMGNAITRPDELPERLQDNSLVALPTPPLMHASSQWLGFHQLFTGGKIVMPELGVFDPPTIWRLIGGEAVFMLVIVGDAMARPLLDELEANPDAWSTDSLWVIGSGGAVLSAATRERILRLLPNRLVADGLGSSETGTVGSKVGQGGATFVLNDQTAVLDDDGAPVGPGGTGRLARRGHIPLGYLNDPDKTAATFVEYDGDRWVLPGDLARVEDDGTVTLLGRGSTSINTGGEKVFPEEVETALTSHPGVTDAVVVGVPDDQWGNRVVAVVSLTAPDAANLDELQAHCRQRLAGYKLPRGLAVVDTVQRTAAGKPDYRWARDAAVAAGA